VEEDTQPTADTRTKDPWQLGRSSKRRPQDTTEASHDTMGYDYRVLAMRLALRAASPYTRQKIAEEYAALLAEDPLLLPPRGLPNIMPPNPTSLPPSSLHTHTLPPSAT
jgi:hypothetical protein